jgi:KaiC/GvpD/RAD55 family RecA-like ATPase
LSENALKHLNYCRSQLLQNPEDSKNILKNFNNALEHDFPDSSFGGRVFTLSQSLSEKIKLEHALAGAGKKIPGYETGFPILTQKTGGFEKELYVFSGASGMGKSTLLIQLAWQLVNESDNIRVILFSLDHSHIDVTTKIISQAGRLPVKYVKNPFIPDIDLENKRHEAIKMATHIKDRLQIVDEGKGTITIGDIENFIHSARVNKEDEFILIIDPVMKISCPENDFNPQKEIILARKLKRLSRENNMTIICSIDLKAQTKPPCKEHLKEYPTFMSEAYVLLMMYCDFVNNFETLFLEWQWNSEDLMVPITEISVVKNKMDEFRGKLFFRYFNSMAFYKECAAEEIQNYNEMLDNLDEWEDKEITVRPDGTTAPKVKNK